MPVVVGLHHHDGHLGLVLVQVAGGETGERGKAHGTDDAVAVHVSYALVDVVHAGAHLGEAGGIAPPFFCGPRHHRVESADSGRFPLVDPLVDALLGNDDLGCLVPVLGRNMAGEHVGWFDYVVIDTHENHVVELHIHSRVLLVTLWLLLLYRS